MLRGRIGKFVLAILLIAGLSDVTLAAATVGDSICALSEAISPAREQLLIDSVAVSDSSLATIGTEILQVPSAEQALGNLALTAEISPEFKPLPAIPAAVTLVLTGFLCVSLVRDRKTWLAVCVGLFCLGQLGISALPKFANNLRNALKPGDISSSVINRIANTAAGLRQRCEIEQTRYIALLRMLSGIPDHGRSSTSNRISAADIVCDLVISAQSNLKVKMSTYAAYISNLFGFQTLSSCPVRSTGHNSAFTPAFCIATLPHGPPAAIS